MIIRNGDKRKSEILRTEVKERDSTREFGVNTMSLFLSSRPIPLKSISLRPCNGVTNGCYGPIGYTPVATRIQIGDGWL